MSAQLAAARDGLICRLLALCFTTMTSPRTLPTDKAQHALGDRPAARDTWRLIDVSRWLNRVSSLVLAIAAGLVVAAGAPAVLHRGTTRERPTQGTQASPNDARTSPSTETSTGPRFVFEDDDEPRVTELERIHPNAMWPGRRQRTD